MAVKALPHDLFHSHILPDLFSDHLHRLLVNSERPQWDPFRTLPCVSREFSQSCHSLYYSVFGTMKDGPGTIQDILHCSLEHWNFANKPPTRAMPIVELTEADLKFSNSLIQVYICAALAKSYFNLDVLWPLELERRRIAGEFDDEDMVDESSEVEHDGTSPLVHSRWFKMRDDNMHRLFLPLTCAIQLCDEIQPARLVHIVAGYLAEIIPYYTAAPPMLKYTQDLEKYVSGGHKLGTEILLEWIRQTLGLVKKIGQLIKDIQNAGKMVQSFTRSSSIPVQVLQETNIFYALDKVAAQDWGEGTASINEHAKEVKLELQLAGEMEECL